MNAPKFLFLSILLILVLSFGSVGSFTLSGYQWPNQVFRFYVNPSNGDMTDTQAIRSIRRAGIAWKPWVRPSYAGTTTNHRTKNDGINTIFFRKAQYGALASTYVFSRGNEILDVDIVFWDNPWKFYPGSKGCNTDGGYYITDVATHEFGHAIGLGHSRKKIATMFKRSFTCTTTARTLDPDDSDAASRLYGTPQITSMKLMNPGD
jgi:hypothetical protein